MTCCRHHNFFCFAVFVCVCFKFDKVDVNDCAVWFYNRNGSWTDFWTKSSFEFFKHFVEVCVFHVYFGNVNHCTFFIFFCKFVCFLCTNFNAVFCTNCEENGFTSFDAFVHTKFKVEKTRNVDHVEFCISVFKWCNCTGKGTFSFDFFCFEVAYCVAIVSFAKTIACLVCVKQSFNKACFTAASVTSNQNVFDF